MRSALKQTWQALTVWPERNHWRSAFMLAVPTFLVIAGIGYLSGWVSPAIVTDPATIGTVLLLIFLAPALIEELLFRGVLLAWVTRWTPRWSGWITTLLFVAWHPILAFTIGPPWAAMFLQPSFWIATFLIGIIFTHIRIVSGSLWPVILIHWGTVVIWKLFLGGPFY